MSFGRVHQYGFATKKTVFMNIKIENIHQMRRVAFVNVRVYNRGKEDFDGEGKWILIYWVQASTGITQKAWKGRELYENKWQTGGVLEARPIDKKIKAGGYRDFSIDWKLPYMLKEYP